MHCIHSLRHGVTASEKRKEVVPKEAKNNRARKDPAKVFPFSLFFFLLESFGLSVRVRNNRMAKDAVVAVASAAADANQNL